MFLHHFFVAILFCCIIVPNQEMAMANDFIEIKGAREHNLKNVDISIPKNKLTVVTGLSGSGKSSLAFDTIYAEGQRRYVESLSAYARQFLELMKKPDLPEEQRQEYLEAVTKGTSRLSNLITNMLKLNKLESRKIAPMPEAYDLCRQLGECAISFEQIWDQKNIEFEADFEDEAMIYADHELMELVWNNLLSNAFKFTEPGGIVRMTQKSDDDYITVTVSDTGCGMSQDTIKHIFDKFYQGDSSHATEGNGLGLALVHRILQIAGASVAVDSKEGEGTTFTVRIPAEKKTERNVRE